MVIKFIDGFLLSVAVGVLMGCATSGGKVGSDGNASAFARYAENVFRRQNNVTSEIMTLTADEFADPARYELLLKSEKNMHGACALLNDYAERVQEGKESGWYYRTQVAAAVKACDHATQQLESLLGNAGPKAVLVNHGGE